MPTKYIVKNAISLTSTPAVPPPNVAGVDIASKTTGSDTYDFTFNPDGTRRVIPNNIAISYPILAGSLDTPVFIADDAYQVVKINEVHSVVGGGSAAVTVKKCTGTTAPASGTAMHASAIDLTATINTNISPTLVATTSTLTLAAGDKVSLDFSGTLTGLVGVITINLKRVPA